MGHNQDIRWIQRFSNFNKAMAQLVNGVRLAQERTLSDLEQQGLIQSFEYTHELAWNVMKDYLVYQGDSTVGGSRDATRSAFQLAIIEDGVTWMNMINSRNQTSHTYNQETANEIFQAIKQEYYPAFLKFQEKMAELKRKEEQQNL